MSSCFRSKFGFRNSGRVRHTRSLPITLLAMGLGMTLVPLAAQDVQAQTSLLFDRELPVLGGARNASVGGFTGTDEIVGDDFALPTGSYRVDHIRAWSTFGSVDDPAYNLGNWFDTGSLYLGSANPAQVFTVSTPLSIIKQGRFLAGSNQTDNPDVTFTRVKFSSPNGPVDLRPSEQLWQMDFTNLNLILDGGVLYTFGAGAQGSLTNWPALLTNTSLSGSRQDGADNMVHAIYEPDPSDDGLFDYGNADISVQVYGTVVPEPGAFPGAVSSLLCAAWLLRRRRKKA